MPVDYSKAKIYRIVCNETGEQYFGSTTQTLSLRIAQHRMTSNTTKAKQIIERGNYEIILCEEFPCENKEQLNKCERKWIEENECLNKNIPGRNPTEYRLENKERIYKWFAENRNNTEEYKEYQKQYRKQYYLKNREIILQKSQEKRNQTMLDPPTPN